MSFIEEWNQYNPEYAGVEHESLAASWGPHGTESLEIICKGSQCSLYVNLEDLKGLIRKVENFDG